MLSDPRTERSTHRRAGVRRAHRWLGLALSLPLLLWAVTGFLFHWKPGWKEAYAPLPLPSRPLSTDVVTPTAAAGWLETRRLATSLGEHWLVRDEAGWRHLDARTGEPFPEPQEATLAAFLDEALASDRARYGTLLRRGDDGWITTTGARIRLDWTTLRISQEGGDTRLIDRLYRIHYLQWTGIPAIDRPFAVVGLLALVLLAGAGLRLAWRN